VRTTKRFLDSNPHASYLLHVKVSTGRKDATRLKIEQMEAEREERRRAMQELKQSRKTEEERIRQTGNTGDVDFVGLVQAWRDEHSGEAQEHEDAMDKRICICVRKSA
jgi:hypothetical protein